MDQVQTYLCKECHFTFQSVLDEDGKEIVPEMCIQCGKYHCLTVEDAGAYQAGK